MYCRPGCIAAMGLLLRRTLVLPVRYAALYASLFYIQFWLAVQIH